MNNNVGLGTNSKQIQPFNSLVTLLRVEPGYANHKGEVYDENGVFIDFPREWHTKRRPNLDISSVVKQFTNKSIGCLVHERRNYSYYHWTYETLPKLIFLSSHRKEINIDKLYFHYGFSGHPYQRQALTMLGFSFLQVLDAKRIKALMAKEIIVIKLNESRLKPSIELCKVIKSAFIKRQRKSFFRRIYLTREHLQTGRKVVNESQLRKLLRAHGFQTVIADNLTVASQAKLFNESQYIISPHGAGLANIVFCEPGTRILELFNQVDRSAWSQIYSRIAETCRFEWIPLGPKQVVQNGKDPHRTDFFVDLNAIKAIFRDWGL